VDEPIDVGTLYRTLRRMEAEGWLTSEWAEGQGPRRRVYSITPLGLQVLHSWASGLARNKQAIENFLDFYGERFRPQEKRRKSAKSCKPGSC
jgi:DNA-binding PadR family transcriptional regulator